MIKYIEKRDGSIAKFNPKNIYNAVYQSAKSCNEFVDADNVVRLVIERLEKRNQPTINIEIVQDEVEFVLMGLGYFKAAKSYITYRNMRDAQRNLSLGNINAESSVEEYLSRADWRVNANANQGYSLGGMILNVAGKVTANYWLNKIYPKEIGQAHRNGDIHIHDLDMLSIYCCGWSLKNVLREGMNGIAGKIESNPPKHLSSALNQALNHLCCCFTGDTKIWKADGSTITFQECLDQNIKELDVLSYNEKTGKVVKSRMTDIGVYKEVDELIELDFGYSKIKCTPDHKFFTRNRGWVEAKDLSFEDDIMSLPLEFMYVYKVKNKITGDIYVGSHITKDIQDGYLGSGVNITEQIKTYGKENFSKKILGYFNNSLELRKEEEKYVRKYAKKYSNRCINILIGLNYGYNNANGHYSINKNLIGSQINKILVYKGKSCFYATSERLKELAFSDYKIGTINLVYNNGKRNFYNVKNNNLVKGGINLTVSAGMAGNCQTSDFRKKLSQRNKDPEFIKKRSKGLRKVGADGLTNLQRSKASQYKDGLTLAQYIGKQLSENGTSAFCNSEIQRANAAKANTPEKRRQAKWTVISKYADWLSKKYKYITSKIWDDRKVKEKYSKEKGYLQEIRVSKFQKVCTEFPEFSKKYKVRGE